MINCVQMLLYFRKYSFQLRFALTAPCSNQVPPAAGRTQPARQPASPLQIYCSQFGATSQPAVLFHICSS